MSDSTLNTTQRKAGEVIHRLASSKVLPFILLAAVLLITYFRDPRYFTSPRMWAEEGTRHFAFSYHNPWFQALFEPQVGYLNFWTNFATVLATIPPLELAPLVTTLMALIAQTIPVALILWSKSPLWDNWPRKMLGAAVVLFVPLTQELWLNSVNDYPYFATAAFLLLIEETPTGTTRRWVYRGLLLLAGLTGLHSVFLIPFFILAALWERQPERWIQTAVLMACAVLHLYFIATFRDNASIGERFAFLGAASLGNILLSQTFNIFLFGLDNAQVMGQELYQLAINNLDQFQRIGRTALVGLGLLLVWFSWNLPWKLRILFLGSFATLLVLPSMFTGISDKYWLVATGLHQRLFLSPNIILGWMLLLGIQFTQGKGWQCRFRNITSVACALLLGSAIFWGITYFDDHTRNVERWPDWKTEVQMWEQDPTYLLQIDPPGWVVELKQP